MFTFLTLIIFTFSELRYSSLNFRPEYGDVHQNRIKNPQTLFQSQLPADA